MKRLHNVVPGRRNGGRPATLAETVAITPLGPTPLHPLERSWTEPDGTVQAETTDERDRALLRSE